MENSIIAIIIVAVGGVLAWVRTRGMEAGASAERKKTAVVVEQMEGRIADAEAEVEHNKPLANKLASARERIARRRGVG